MSKNTHLDEIQEAILKHLNGSADAKIQDTIAFFGPNIDQQAVLGVLKRLASYAMVEYEGREEEGWRLTPEAQEIVENGSHEVRLWNAIPADGSLAVSAVIELFGPTNGRAGQARAFKNKWIKQDPADPSRIVRAVALEISDVTRDNLRKIALGESLEAADLKDLKHRKLIEPFKSVSFEVRRGPSFALTVPRLPTDLTWDLVQSMAWRQGQFKQYNFAAAGQVLSGGHLHPLLKVREEFRQIFFEMGFQEMPTNRYVESSFWNFDTLFQAQQHPSRDAHDTFFLREPRDTLQLPPDYVQRTGEMHSRGGHGSIGHRYEWKESEARRNILRTHTTAVSSRMLWEMAGKCCRQEFEARKYFSIDRVFRNETLDATHLAEFHQIEGLVADRGLTLGHLIGMLREFFGRLGMTQLRFKPAYNPYTEPSMEVFAYHPGLARWIEVGNSGVFRPEMLLPMGLPADVTVIAWGLSLERPTMIKYGLSNIRDLVGHRVDLAVVQSNPICRLDK